MLLVLNNMLFSGASFSKHGHFSGLPAVTSLAGLVNGLQRFVNEAGFPGVTFTNWAPFFIEARDTSYSRNQSNFNIDPSKVNLKDFSKVRQSWFARGSSLLGMDMLIAVEGLPAERLNELVELCLDYDFRLNNANMISEVLDDSRKFKITGINGGGLKQGLAKVSGQTLSNGQYLGAFKDFVGVLIAIQKIMALLKLPKERRETNNVFLQKHYKKILMDSVMTVQDELGIAFIDPATVTDASFSSLLADCWQVKYLTILQTGWAPHGDQEVTEETLVDPTLPIFVEPTFGIFYLTKTLADFQFTTVAESFDNLSLI